jgi:riboflavin biosynthesis pyrimidine reductase
MDRFNRLVARKVSEAERAAIGHLTTVSVSPVAATEQSIGNAWTREHYDGPFHLGGVPDEIPATALVFVESRDGNTEAENPGSLGGGPTDKHLIYEGLSRVAVDAVAAGAGTARGESTFFSIWHPQLVALRASLGLPRHPAQIVISARGDIDLSAMVFNVPEVPVFVIAGEEGRRRRSRDFLSRPWLTVVSLDNQGLRGAFQQLRRDHGLRRLSAIGGRATATALLDAGLIQEVLLTTTQRVAGRPGTPFYTGVTKPTLEPVVTKTTMDGPDPIVFRRLFTGAGSR